MLEIMVRPDNTRIEASPTKISVTMQPHISSFSSDTPANITLDQINNLAKFTRVAAEAKVVKISCKQELRPGARPGYGMIISYGASFPFQYLQGEALKLFVYQLCCPHLSGTDNKLLSLAKSGGIIDQDIHALWASP